jgi:hypothetical protein
VRFRDGSGLDSTGGRRSGRGTVAGLILVAVMAAAMGCSGGDSDGALPEPSGNPLTTPIESIPASALPASPAGGNPLGASATADDPANVRRSPSASRSAGAPGDGKPSKRRRPDFIDGVFGSGNGEACDPYRAGTTGIKVTLERLDHEVLCLLGFRMHTVPVITLTSPTGTVRRFPADRDDDGWLWRMSADLTDTPLSELGRHTFRITGIAGSGPKTTSGVIDVVPALSPDALLRGGFNAAGFAVRGGQLVVDVAGFPAGSTVYLTVFGPGPIPDGYTVMEDLPDLVTNERGEGHALWKVPVGSAGGEYGIWVDPLPVVDDQCIGDGGLCLFFEIE